MISTGDNHRSNKFELVLTVFVLLHLLFAPNSVFAQSVKITGTVTDETGEPIVGAGIVVDQASNKGTNTDLSGNFVLDISPFEHKTISVLFLGFETANISLDGRKHYDITLVQEHNKLDEVVVVAFGTQRKLSVTGSLSSINNKDLKKSPVSNFQSSLTGRLPGLTISQPSGMPGDEKISMKMRGEGTYGDTSPLILIDGVPRDDMSSLDANEVENVTILKDAAATAVFGVRGANGVILVTTQRGKTGKANVSLSAEYGIQQVLTRGSYKIDSWDYALLCNEKNKNVGLPPAYTDWQIQKFKDGDDPFFPNRDAWDEYTKLGQQYKVNASVSGGTDKISYFVNASYTHQGSIFATEPKSKLGYDPSFWMNRLNVRANLDFNLSEDVRLSLNLSSYLNIVNRAPINDDFYEGNIDLDRGTSTFIVGGLNREAPVFPGPTIPANTYDDNGKLLEEGGFIKSTGYQLYARMNLAGYIRQNKTTVNSSASLDWNMRKITEGLKFKAMFSYDLYATGVLSGVTNYNWYSYHQATGPEDKSYYYQISADNAFNGYYADKGINYRFGNGGRISGSYYKFNTQLQFSYDRQFAGKHNVSAIVLGQYDNYVSNSAASLYLPYNMLYISARANYNYDDRYTAEINLGINGSEQFAKGNRFGFFPAASASWNISQEHFIKDNVDRKWLDLLKIRASYGIVGNDKIAGGARFLYLDDVKVVDGGPIPTLGRGKTVVTNILGNKDLTWEKAHKQNYGIDVGFLNGFTFNADFFWEDRRDILISRSTIPLVQGMPLSALPRVNMGRVKNHGYELVLSYQRFFANDMSLFVSANYNFARNVVVEADEVKLETGRGGYMYPYRTTGFSIGQNWMLEVDKDSRLGAGDGAGNGYINDEEDLAKYGRMYDSGGFVRSFLGQWKFKDQNGDGKIDIKDQVPIGYPSSTPEITYGFNIGWSWKGLDISVLFQGVSHKQGFYVVGMFGNGHLTGEWETHAWTSERYANGEKITYQALNGDTLAGGAANERNDFVLSDMSYIRLKNAEIGYSLPKKWSKKLKMQNIRFAVVGQNLWNTYNARARSADPETNNENQYPITRNINFCVQLQF